MGKKSLLAPTSGENDGKGENPEKKPLTASGPAKKAAPKPAKKKPATAAKKKAVSSNAAKKKAAPKKASGKKKAPTGKTTAAKSSVKPKAKKNIAAKKKPIAEKKPAAGKKPVSGEKAGAVAKPPVQKPGELQKEAASQTRGGEDAGKVTACPAAAPEEKKAMDPMQKMAAFGIAVLAVLLAMVLWTSAANVDKFYVVPVDGQLEIWKGRFSPNGVDKIYTLRSASMPAEPKAVYSKEEAYGFIFEGLIAEADALLGAEEMPDFEGIRRTLANAGPFAVSSEMSGRLQKRQDKIDMMALVYKADVLSGKGTVADLTLARKSLEKAMDLNLDEAERGLIQQKLNWIDQKLAEAAE